MDRIELFRIFTRVVETASFTRAADTLGVPRSSVSTAISRLEIRVGARLLQRTTRRVMPTPDGVAFYERCLRMIADLEDVESMFQQGVGKPVGKLRVDVPGRIGRLIVIPALPEFLEAYPEIELTLGVRDRAVNMVEEPIDCVLRTGSLPDSGMIARAIGALPLINVASPIYLAQHGTPQTNEDLVQHWAVNYASPVTGRVEPWEVTDGTTPRFIPMRARVTVNSAEAYIAASLAGLGMIQIPAYDVRDQLAAGTLIELLPTQRAVPLPLTLLYPHRHLPQRVRVFTDWLEALLRQKLL